MSGDAAQLRTLSAARASWLGGARDVPDPEIPVLSIVDLGIVRYVRREADGRLHVGLTPTYSAVRRPR